MNKRVKTVHVSTVVNDETAIAKHKTMMGKKGWTFSRYVPYDNGCVSHVRIEYKKQA